MRRSPSLPRRAEPVAGDDPQWPALRRAAQAVFLAWAAQACSRPRKPGGSARPILRRDIGPPRAAELNQHTGHAPSAGDSAAAATRSTTATKASPCVTTPADQTSAAIEIQLRHPPVALAGRAEKAEGRHAPGSKSNPRDR